MKSNNKEITLFATSKKENDDLFISYSSDRSIRIWHQQKDEPLDMTGVSSSIDYFCALYTLKKNSPVSKSHIFSTISQYRLNFIHFYCS